MKPAQAKELIASMQDRYRGIKVVYANKGEVGDPDTLIWQATSGMDDQIHVRLAQARMRQSIWIVGGGRTTPAFIRALAPMRQRRVEGGAVRHAEPTAPSPPAGTSGVPGFRAPSQ